MKKFIKTQAKKEKSCYVCNSAWAVGADIYIMQEVLTDRYELICAGCGLGLELEQGSKVEIKSETRVREVTTNGRESSMEDILKELKEIKELLVKGLSI